AVQPIPARCCEKTSFLQLAGRKPELTSCSAFPASTSTPCCASASRSLRPLRLFGDGAGFWVSHASRVRYVACGTRGGCERNPLPSAGEGPGFAITGFQVAIARERHLSPAGRHRPGR